MAPFRPTNINKRLYPGNGSIIGPTTTPSVSCGITTCTGVTNACDACICQNLVLGCRCSFCGCPCCDIVCTCDCTVCTRTVPSGMWNSSEVYTARVEDAWGPSSSSNTSAVCQCCCAEGYADISNLTDCGGFFIFCQGSGKYWVAPSNTEVVRGPGSGDAIILADDEFASGGWLNFSCGQLQSFASCGQAYWDARPRGNSFWTTNSARSFDQWIVDVQSGSAFAPGPYSPFDGNKSTSRPIRAFRYTPS